MPIKQKKKGVVKAVKCNGLHTEIQHVIKTNEKEPQIKEKDIFERPSASQLKHKKKKGYKK